VNSAWAICPDPLEDALSVALPFVGTGGLVALRCARRGTTRGGRAMRNAINLRYGTAVGRG
jgi:hypothetical protein